MNIPNFESWNHWRALRFSGVGVYTVWALELNTSKNNIEKRSLRTIILDFILIKELNYGENTEFHRELNPLPPKGGYKAILGFEPPSGGLGV
jgi:hypothetical protein